MSTDDTCMALLLSLALMSTGVAAATGTPNLLVLGAGDGSILAKLSSGALCAMISALPASMPPKEFSSSESLSCPAADGTVTDEEPAVTDAGTVGGDDANAAECKRLRFRKGGGLM